MKNENKVVIVITVIGYIIYSLVFENISYGGSKIINRTNKSQFKSNAFKSNAFKSNAFKSNSFKSKKSK